MNFESLENRRHLSASLNSAGLLCVGGTEGHDNILIWQPQFRVTRVEVNGDVTDFNTSGVAFIKVNSGAGDDLVILGKRSPNAKLLGGDGNDSLSSGDGNDILYGGRGDDYLFGRGGNDRILGGSGADDIFGGDGERDVIDYSHRTNRVDICIGFEPNDGEAGERDNVHADIEIAYGGSGNDKLRSWGSHGVTLVGNDGIDTLYGTSWDDVLDGGAGRDQYKHVDLGGNDFVRALDGERDTIIGGTGFADLDTDSLDMVESL